MICQFRHRPTKSTFKIAAKFETKLGFLIAQHVGYERAEEQRGKERTRTGRK